MPRLPNLARVALIATSATAFSLPAWAQENRGSNQTSPDGRSVTQPDLTVASVKLADGYRISKVIGSTVTNGQNQQIGTVDDVILNGQNQATLVVLSVGGFLGVGGKLVALPYTDLHRENGKTTLPSATKEALNTMPNFTYGQ